jgi:VIT1/CCC1 family predicted Fe2+/Mn2+ transporter
MVLLLFGLANLFADGVSMGLGNYLSIRSDQKLYAAIREREFSEITHNPDLEAEETVTILMSQGFSEIDARAITILYRKNPEYWATFMMNNELKIPDPRDDDAKASGIATLVSFIFFGAIPLVPFILMPSFESNTVFGVSIVGTGIALGLLGFFKARVSGGRLAHAVLEVVTVGGLAACVAFGVGTLFSLM